MRLAAVVSPHPPLEWSHAQEYGHNYEMVYAPEVSSTGQMKSESGDWGTGTGGGRALSAGPQTARAWRAWGQELGKREGRVGKVQAEKDFLAFLPGGGGTEDGAFCGTLGKPRSSGVSGAWPPSSSWPRLPLRPEEKSPAYRSVGPERKCGINQQLKSLLPSLL